MNLLKVNNERICKAVSGVDIRQLARILAELKLRGVRN